MSKVNNDLFQKPVLVTGVAGFIGFSLARSLLKQGISVVGLDNLNDYYDPQLKQDRLCVLEKEALENKYQTKVSFQFHKIDLADLPQILSLWEIIQPKAVLHMAAQAGVRYSLTNPHAYAQSNLVGFLNVLEACRHFKTQHLVYASSSSVYGANTKMPFSVSDNVDHPVSLYAATKKSNELMAHSYAHLYGLSVTGLRFFTVYGPWGRPDMAVYRFTKAILEGVPIDLYNNGQMMRDFTYIDDIVEGTLSVLRMPAQPDSLWNSDNPSSEISYAPYRLYNIGNNHPTALLSMVETLENILGKKADRRLLPMQMGDVPATYANIDALSSLTGFSPKTSLEEGLRNYVQWYKEYKQKP
jgi:UDP-glucuronate 4-epimerase